MSLEDDLKDVGDSIGRLVDNAVNSKDFQQLNEQISNAINQFVYPSQQNRANTRTNSGADGPHSEPGFDDFYSSGKFRNPIPGASRSATSNRSASDSPTYRHPSSDYNRQASYRQNHTNTVETYRHSLPAAQHRDRFMPPTDLAFSGGVQTVSGYATTAIFGISTVSVLIPSIIDVNIPGMVCGAVFGVITVGGCALISRGKKNWKLVKEFKQIRNILGTREYISIKELSDRMHQTKEVLIEDISLMIEKGMFRQGHLDRQATCLMVTNRIYQQYEELEHQQMLREQEEARKQKALEASGLTPEYQAMLSECESYIEKIHQCNEDLPGEVISAKLNRLELVVGRILTEAKKDPKKADELHKFMDYYMPTTWKLLDAYRTFEMEPIQSENIQKTKLEIESSLDTINSAFEKLLDDLFQTTAWDISSDISVLETMLAQEGLTGHGMNGSAS